MLNNYGYFTNKALEVWDKFPVEKLQRQCIFIVNSPYSSVNDIEAILELTNEKSNLQYTAQDIYEAYRTSMKTNYFKDDELIDRAWKILYGSEE